MRGIVLATAVVLSGCVTPPPKLADFEQICTGAPFPEYGRCLETSMQAGYPSWRLDSHGDLVETYLAWLNAAGKRVQNGAMDEEEARMGAAMLKIRLKEVASQREANTAVSRQADMNQMLMGLALMQGSQYTIPPASAPSPPITCRTSAPNAITGQVITTCQ
jgi:hypothetical protein